MYQYFLGCNKTITHQNPTAVNVITRSDIEHCNSKGQNCNFWKTKEDSREGMLILDLGCAQEVNTIQLVNTHNGQNRDRSTKEFRVSFSYDSDDFEELIHTNLEDSREEEDPLPIQEFYFQPVPASRIKVEILDFYGNGGGLQYFTAMYDENVTNILENEELIMSEFSTQNYPNGLYEPDSDKVKHLFIYLTLTNVM